MNEQFTAGTPVGGGSTSSIQTPTRGNDNAPMWKTVAQMARAMLGLRGGNQATADQLATLKRGGFLCIPNPHPFKIYNVPSVCVANPDPDADWLVYRIRAGRVGDLDVDGTDDVANPDDDDVPLETGNITVTAGEAQFFFWIELSDPGSVKTATIKYGADPNTNGWADYPDTDGRFILIGWVDTTDTANKQGVVRQILRADIPMGIASNDCTAGVTTPVEYVGYRFDPPPA